jgi:hypothetical protein
MTDDERDPNPLDELAELGVRQTFDIARCETVFGWWADDSLYEMRIDLEAVPARWVTSTVREAVLRSRNLAPT